MNEFILLLWLADVVKVLQGLGIVGLCTICGAAVMCVVADDEEKIELVKYKKHLIATSVFCLFAFLLPRSETIQMYAALNATKDIANTQIGKKALAALEANLDSIIEEGDRE